jgi:hypothetical protein
MIKLIYGSLARNFLIILLFDIDNLKLKNKLTNFNNLI